MPHFKIAFKLSLATTALIMFSPLSMASEKSCNGQLFAVSETELYSDPTQVTKNTLAEGTYFRYEPWVIDHISEYIDPQRLGLRVETYKNPQLTVMVTHDGRVLKISKTYQIENQVYQGTLQGKPVNFRIFRLDPSLFQLARGLSRDDLTIVITVKDDRKKACQESYKVVIEDPEHAH